MFARLTLQFPSTYISICNRVRSVSFSDGGLRDRDIRGGPFDFWWGSCRIFRLLDIFFYCSSPAGFFLKSPCPCLIFFFNGNLKHKFWSLITWPSPATQNSPFRLLKTTFTRNAFLSLHLSFKVIKSFIFIQCTKKCISTNLRLVDFPVRLVDVIHAFSNKTLYWSVAFL